MEQEQPKKIAFSTLKEAIDFLTNEMNMLSQHLYELAEQLQKMAQEKVETKE